MRDEYFGFAVNEFQWRRIIFSRHFSHEAAERAHYTPFTQGEDPVSADLDVTVIKGREAFEAWAKECNYIIDWKSKVLIHAEAKKKR